MARPVKKRKLIRDARKSGALRAKKRELREEGMSRREARKAAKEMITMSAKPTKEVKSPTRKVSVKRSVDPMMSRSRVGKTSSPLSDIKSPLSDTKSYLVDNYRVKATDQYRASEYQDRIRQNINSESIAREAGEKTYKRIDPTTGSVVMAKVKKPSRMAKHGGALAIMIAPVKSKKMKAVKKAPGGAAMKKMPEYKDGGKLVLRMNELISQQKALQEKLARSATKASTMKSEFTVPQVRKMKSDLKSLNAKIKELKGAGAGTVEKATPLGKRVGKDGKKLSLE